MARYVRVPARCLHRLPDNLPFELAALTEPCCVAYQAVVVNARVHPGDVVVVIGPGPIGLLCAHVARICGAGAVVLAGLARDRARLQLGLGLGATHTVDMETQKLADAVQRLGDGQGADVVVDAAGASAALQQALAHDDDVVERCQLDPRPLISRVAPLTEWRSCFDGMAEGTLVKAVLLP